MTHLITANPGLVLVGNENSKYAESLKEVKSVPKTAISSIVTILRFLSSLLRHASTSKSVFNSIDLIVELLGAADENIVDLAIEVLANLVAPPLAHHQQTPEVTQHINPLASSKPSVHTRIMCLARGWGSRGSGLGLYACVTADDSSLGQGSLPGHAGELAFDYYDTSNNVQTIHLKKETIFESDSPKSARSTSELFFDCIEQAGGRDRIPSDKLFSLLTQIRLAREFHTNATRSFSVQRRLKAIICALYAHPSQEILTGYFQAQPELCVEMIDLLKPTISSASVSSTPFSSSTQNNEHEHNSTSAISIIAESSEVPYGVKMVAIEALTALVSRRDGSNGGITSRQVNVLQELGVGKGQYLGFLPTLIRYSLASLNTYLAIETTKDNDMDISEPTNESNLSIDIGFEFVKAVKAPPIPLDRQIERGLEFIDSVLTLTSAVVSVPNGTASLTDCGLIPALMSTIALHSRISQARNISNIPGQETYAESLLNYISAQSVQIIDGAIAATHSSALNTFYELKGIDLLVTRLYEEIQTIKQKGEQLRSLDEKNRDSHEMDTSEDGKTSFTPDKIRPLRASRRVLLFCIISCLNVVLHQQESTTTTSSGGAQLRKTELTESLKDIMDNVGSYGGALTALTATLLSDVMNSDPQVVHHVHSSGLSKSFLSMIGIKEDNQEENDDFELQSWDYPALPLTSELVMALPNVLSALSLTEEGANIVKAANPFPALLSIFYCPDYVMPISNCLLNEMSAIVGSGLDELMRHVPTLRELGIKALVQAINRIVKIGKKLLSDEKTAEQTGTGFDHLEDERTCLMQYAYNISQLLEQILHNEVLATPFIDAGGLESLLELYPVLMPFGRQFLSHVSCLSNPATANITHSTTTNAITLTIKCIASNYDSQKTIRKMSLSLDNQLKNLLEKQEKLRELDNKLSSDSRNDGLLAEGILDSIPNRPLHELPNTSETKAMSEALACYLREVVVTEWLVNILSSVIRAACQRSNDMGSSWIGTSREQWKKEISSDTFSKLMQKLSSLHRSTIFEVCRIRTEDQFEELDSKRCRPRTDRDPSSLPPMYRLRIVCQEGAVVRDGIDIDSCSSVGSLQMGEIVEAYDRCINSSGVMRYHTSRGWVSEQTRGHGREPIAEVLSIVPNSDPIAIEESITVDGKELKRIEWEVPSLRAASASILGRLQNCQKTLLACLSRVVVQGIRGLPTRSLSVPHSAASTYAGAVVRLLRTHIQSSFEMDILQEYFTFDNRAPGISTKKTPKLKLNCACVSLYLSTALELLHVCLYEEKRERRILNIPLLMSILAADKNNQSNDTDSSKTSSLPASGIFGAIRFVCKHSMNDMAIHSQNEHGMKINEMKNSSSTSFSDNSRMSQGSNKLRLSKSVAASLPPTINFLRRLASRPLILDSQISSALSRLKPTDLAVLIGEEVNDSKDQIGSSGFVAGKFARELHCMIADITLELWTDPRISCAPAHIVHPIVSLVGEVLACLEEARKPLSTESSSSRSGIALISGSLNEGSNRDVSELQDRVRVLRNLSESMSVLFGVGGSSRLSSAATGSGDDNNIDGQGLPSRPPPPIGSSNAPFEPSDAVIERLTEMGFSREHALEAVESTETNRVEDAMEYALAHPPSSPATIERRQAAREERRRQRERVTAELLGNAPSAPDALSEGGERTDTNETGSVQTQNANNTRSESSEEPNSSQSQNSRPGSAPMDIDENVGRNNNSGEGSDNGSKSKSQLVKNTTLTESEKNAQAQRDTELLAIARTKRCLTSLREQLHTIALNLIEGGSSGLQLKENPHELDFAIPKECTRLGRLDEGSGFGDGEAEALTTVICHFLLDLCGRYPTDRSKLINLILDRIKEHTTTEGSITRVVPGHESDFAALCHASVILFRALPLTRGLFLARGMLGTLLSCVRCFLSSKGDGFGWPKWLPPVLLLLDVFAQPTAAAIECDKNNKDEIHTEGTASSSSRRSEFTRACIERKKYSSYVSKAAEEIFATMNGNAQSLTSKKKRQKEKLGKKHDSINIDEKKSKKPESQSEQTGEEKEVAKASDTDGSVRESFPPIPVYTPLIPSEEAETCVSICLRLLRHRPKGQISDQDKAQMLSPPPGIVHASLLLLARILRSHRIASNCLRMGGAELLLSLPPQSRFVGNTCLVGVILRHMLEDESTLRTSMETEIRTTIARLHRQQNRDNSSRNQPPKVKAGSFIQAVIPLICRDPIVFLKAAATSVCVECNIGDSDNRQIAGSSARIVLLSAEERAKNVKLLSEKFGNHSNCYSNSLSHSYSSGSHGTKTGSKVSHTSSSAKTSTSLGTPNLKRGRTRPSSDTKNPKTKSTHHSSTKRGTTPKRSRKEKHEKTSGSSQTNVSGSFILLNGSPTNHIVSLLLTDLTKVADNENENWEIGSPEAISFLRACDYLEILADLVLAVPACAAAIHRYRPPHNINLHNNKQQHNPLSNIRHALSGCPNPPPTAVSYLIHVLLPQERRNNSKGVDDENIKTNDAEWRSANEKKKKILLMKTKLAQSTSRLLVALCARAGEGRMRVVSDLASALRGKGHGKNTTSNDYNPENQGKDIEMWALQSWAELCIGLAAPRSSGINQDNDTALSFQVVKLMLEYGMGHAIMSGIRRINLHHPMASNVASALMRPMEVLTRSSVTSEIEKMVKIEAAEKAETEKKSNKSNENESGGRAGKHGKRSNSSGNLLRRLTIGPSQRAENTFADDVMLEDGFDHDTAERAQRNARRNARRRDARRINYEFARQMVDEGEFDNVESVEDDDEHDDEEEDAEMEELEEVSDTDEDEEMIGTEEEDDSDDESEDDVDEIEVRIDDEENDDEASNSNDDTEGDNSNESEEDSFTDSSNNDESLPSLHQAGDSTNDDMDEDEIEEDDEGNLVDFGWGDEEDNDFFENGGAADEGDEAGTGSEVELEEGWTRIDSGTSFRGVFIGTRHNSDSANDGEGQTRRNLRRRFIIDRSDDALGSLRDILHNSDMQMEALAEIEDHLGIRIMNSHRSSADNSIDQRQRNAGPNSQNAPARDSTGDGLNSRDRGAIGTLPAVHQANAPSESSQLTGYGTGGRWNENSSMEYTYGCGMIRDEHMFLFSGNNEQRDIDSLNMSNVSDTQLFPGGTAAAMHSRAQQHLHPLLCDVELPPINSVFSTLEPHGIRATRPCRSNDTRSGEMSFSSFMASGGFLSSSNGNIIRLNRGPSGTSLIDHHWSRNSSTSANGSSAEARWTDDGQPLDGTTRDFALAFERVLRETITREHRDRVQTTERPSSDDNNGSSNNNESRTTGPMETEDGDGDISTNNQDPSNANETPNANRGQNDSQPRSDSPNETLVFGTNEDDPNQIGRNEESIHVQEQPEAGSTADQDPADSSSNQTMTNNQHSPNPSDSSSNSSSNIEGNTSEGEGVATSLAVGLRLSPRSENSAASANVSTGALAPVNSDTIPQDDSLATENEAVDMQMDVAEESESVESNNATSNVENSNETDETSQEALPSSGTVTDEVSNANGLTCPPGMDLEVFNSLPIDVQQEVVEQHQATLMNVIEQLDSSSGLDPEALAALPEEMQREAIAQEQQERLREQSAPANPSNAQEMDNASFVASLSPDLREEILLGADDTFLNSLPPDIIAEAQILRERASSHHRNDRSGSRVAAQNSEGASNNRLPFGRMQSGESNNNMSTKRRHRTGKVKVESDKSDVMFIPSAVKQELGPLITEKSMKTLLCFMFLLAPIRPKRLLQKLIQNLCTNNQHREAFLVTFVSLLNDDTKSALLGVNIVSKVDTPSIEISAQDDKNGTEDSKNDENGHSMLLEGFPPSKLIGTAPEVVENEYPNVGMFRRRHGNTTIAAIAANLPTR